MRKWVSSHIWNRVCNRLYGIVLFICILSSNITRWFIKYNLHFYKKVIENAVAKVEIFSVCTLIDVYKKKMVEFCFLLYFTSSYLTFKLWSKASPAFIIFIHFYTLWCSLKMGWYELQNCWQLNIVKVYQALLNLNESAISFFFINTWSSWIF